MKLTIESMMYGPDGLAHAEDGIVWEWHRPPPAA